ncbi:uncharacterized protein EV420DRAFT_1622935 [Desarmillaria tabescens]|uniref:Uncharacterized protein n=1 Tax=Armillaria tabescens TaxID=1929756 RepID=A0AA39MQN0_ARMTA|nr:uncharacterized protein EV420DRAFT_1622935 [Desarmillaria tabescens]KAK0443027.1 hypothetical protein EV420DRAFT_1622935 [Desarmillaria tabescens]
MKIVFTADPENPTSKGGVAIVINKQLTLWHHTKTKVIILGRAILLKTRWYGEKEIIILGIYTPNWWPDYMGGDMNFVEDPIDRLLMRADHADVLTAFDNLKELLGLRDGWCRTYPDRKDFSFRCTRSVPVQGANEMVCQVFQSRIDRIYVTDNLFENARIAGVDHDMVSVQIAHEEAPLIGKGRWACLDSILKDHQLAEGVKRLGINALDEITEIRRSGRTQSSNPQRVYQKFITAAMELARERERSVKVQSQLKRSQIEKEIENTPGNPDLSELEQSERLARLKSELRNIK